jgi:hypothetical protein
MSENYVQVPEDGTGKKLRTVQRTVGENQVHDEIVEIARSSDGAAISPAEKSQLPSALTASGNFKTSISEDAVGLAKESNGNLAAIKSKTDNLDVALSTRLKPSDLNLDGDKDLQVDVKTLPNVSLASQANPFSSALPVSDNGGSLTVDGTISVNTLPAGNNNIGDIDVASLPSHLGTVEVRDPNTTTQKLAVDANGKIGVSSLPNVTIGTSIPTGNNNIGDVDLASAIPAGTNYIGKTRLTDGSNDGTMTTGIGPDSSKKAVDVSVTQNRTYKTAKIDHGASGDNTIVSAVAGKKIKVYAVVLVVSNAVNCKWKSGANDISGDMNFNGKGEGYSQDKGGTT